MKKLLVIMIAAVPCVACFAQDHPAHKLTGYYTLEGTTTDAVFANPANGINNGGTLTSDRYGLVDRAYSFASLSNRVLTSPHPKYDFENADSFTFALWVRPNQVRSIDSRMLCVSQIGANEIVLNGTGAGVNAGKVQFLNFDGRKMVAAVQFSSDSTIKLNEWTHIAVTVDKAHNLTRMFLNGRLAGQSTDTVYGFDSASVCIGNHVSNAWGLSGAIDEVRIYHRVLSQADIDALADKADFRAGVLAHYPLDGSAADSAANPSNGDLANVTSASDRFAGPAKAFLFDSLTDRISASYHPKLNFVVSDSFTFSAWIKLTQVTSGDERILTVYKWGAFELIVAGASRGADGGKLMFLNFDGVNTQAQVELLSDSVLKLNEWTHIAVTIDKYANLTKMYLNGRLAAQMTKPFFVFDNAAVMIGNHPVYNWPFMGDIDDVRIHGRVLDQAEILGITYTGTERPGVSDEHIHMYPNPVREVLHFTAAGQAANMQIKVFNAMGQSVMQCPYTRELDVRGFPKGIYFIQVNSGNGSPMSFHKIIVE